MKKMICLIGVLSAFSSLAFAAKNDKGHCYAQAAKYKDLMHRQVLKDLPEGVSTGKTSFSYNQDRYALDNFAETFTFKIPAIGSQGDETDLIYTIVTETWIEAGGKAYICDVLSFNHSKSE